MLSPNGQYTNDGYVLITYDYQDVNREAVVDSQPNVGAQRLRWVTCEYESAQP